MTGPYRTIHKSIDHSSLDVALAQWWRQPCFLSCSHAAPAVCQRDGCAGTDGRGDRGIMANGLCWRSIVLRLARLTAIMDQGQGAPHSHPSSCV